MCRLSNVSHHDPHLCFILLTKSFLGLWRAISCVPFIVRPEISISHCALLAPTETNGVTPTRRLIVQSQNQMPGLDPNSGSGRTGGGPSYIPFLSKLKVRQKLRTRRTQSTVVFHHVIAPPPIHAREERGHMMKGRDLIGRTCT